MLSAVTIALSVRGTQPLHPPGHTALTSTALPSCIHSYVCVSLIILFFTDMFSSPPKEIRRTWYVTMEEFCTLESSEKTIAILGDKMVAVDGEAGRGIG